MILDKSFFKTKYLGGVTYWYNSDDYGRYTRAYNGSEITAGRKVCLGAYMNIFDNGACNIAFCWNGGFTAITPAGQIAEFPR